MKIIIIQGAFLPVPPLMGGAVEKMWFSLGKELSKTGHEVIHISRKFDNLPEHEIIDGVKHVRIKGYSTPKSGLILKIMDLIYTVKVRKLLLTDFDIIVSNTFWSPLILQKRAVNSCFVDVQRMPKGQMKFYKNALCLRANSNSVAEAIKAELPSKYHNKVSMTPNPLPFIPKCDVDFSKKEQTILYTGRIHPEKGLDLLIAAYKKSTQNYKLQIIGPWETSMGGGGKDYLDSLKTLAEGVSIEFLEPIFDTEKLNDYYAKASIFVYPSLAEKGETFGVAPLEAMSWGCVPIVSDLLCFKDFIKDGENGLVFDHRSDNAAGFMANCINAVAHDITLSTKLANKAIQVRETHSIPNIANLFIKDFERLLPLKHE
ncbi:glycosyltransferase family 4 protein [Mucilaginibacter sp. X4EP1]|uniref:glycosyltransferase family 4 protein n=1 Tax=Mucilaginibacter sp. X4EP1 TaxID=2723092 RepID=UPI00216A06A3|nr:glycosyltransferase family 4 protein [Mucilaginibacter sp. X4EP1]MCS3815442.1 glycosyltransferase involved in cell wall biosynthesis [Mucilaginibacter sp. X4EP1]